MPRRGYRHRTSILAKEDLMQLRYDACRSVARHLMQHDMGLTVIGPCPGRNCHLAHRLGLRNPKDRAYIVMRPWNHVSCCVVCSDGQVIAFDSVERCDDPQFWEAVGVHEADLARGKAEWIIGNQTDENSCVFHTLAFLVKGTAPDSTEDAMRILHSIA